MSKGDLQLFSPKCPDVRQRDFGVKRKQRKKESLKLWKWTRQRKEK